MHGILLDAACLHNWLLIRHVDVMLDVFTVETIGPVGFYAEGGESKSRCLAALVWPLLVSCKFDQSHGGTRLRRAAAINDVNDTSR